MTLEPVSEDLILRYLLGEVSAEEQARLEERYFTDDSVFEQVVALEDELVDSYVGGELSPRQREQFESCCRRRPELAQKLEFARSLAEYVPGAPGHQLAEPQQQAQPERRRVASVPRLQAMGWQWAFASAILALTLGCGWLVRENVRLRRQLAQAAADQAALRQHASRAESPGGPAAGPQRAETAPSASPRVPSVSFVLTPGLLRSAGAQRTLVIPPGPHRVQIQVELEGDSYREYLATLETAAGNRVWSGQGLRALRGPEGVTVELELPSSLFRNDDYVLSLAGAPGGGAEVVGAYAFRVVRQLSAPSSGSPAQLKPSLAPPVTFPQKPH